MACRWRSSVFSRDGGPRATGPVPTPSPRAPQPPRSTTRFSSTGMPPPRPGQWPRQRFSRDGRGSRDQASAHGDRRRVDAYVVDERRGVDVAGWWCKTQDICDGTSASRASPSDHKNTSDKNSKAVLRISVITLIRTDTTLDLSQKAEKGKSLLRRPESRFSGPQALTLSRHFYDPGEGGQ